MEISSVLSFHRMRGLLLAVLAPCLSQLPIVGCLAVIESIYADRMIRNDRDDQHHRAFMNPLILRCFEICNNTMQCNNSMSLAEDLLNPSLLLHFFNTNILRRADVHSLLICRQKCGTPHFAGISVGFSNADSHVSGSKSSSISELKLKPPAPWFSMQPIFHLRGRLRRRNGGLFKCPPASSGRG